MHKILGILPQFLVNRLILKTNIKNFDVVISNTIFDRYTSTIKNSNYKLLIFINHLPINKYYKEINCYYKLHSLKMKRRFISVCINKNQYAYLSKMLGKEYVTYIPNGIELKQVDDNTIDKTLKKFNLKNKKFIFSIGRLQEKQKGFSLAIKAFSKLQSKKDLMYVIAGKGNDEPLYINIIQNLHLESKIVLVGFISDEEKLALIKMCEIFIQPSQFEAFGLVGFAHKLIKAKSCT